MKTWILCQSSPFPEADFSAVSKYESAFYPLDTTNTAGELAKKIELPDSVEAPIKKGDIIGKAVYTLNDNTVGSVNLLASESIPLITLKDTCQQLLHRFFLSEPD